MSSAHQRLRTSCVSPPPAPGCWTPSTPHHSASRQWMEGRHSGWPGWTAGSDSCLHTPPHTHRGRFQGDIWLKKGTTETQPVLHGLFIGIDIYLSPYMELATATKQIKIVKYDCIRPTQLRHKLRWKELYSRQHISCSFMFPLMTAERILTHSRLIYMSAASTRSALSSDPSHYQNHNSFRLEFLSWHMHYTTSFLFIFSSAYSSASGDAICI